MDFGLKGKHALVCGASKGLGLACAQALASEGVHLVLVARSHELLEQAAAQLRQMAQVHVTAVAADVTTSAGRQQALQAAASLPSGAPSQFDIVVTNAGGPAAGNFRDWDVETWMQALNANMLSAIELIRATVDGMTERRWGRIVNITSSTVKAPNSHLGLSNGARCGLTGFVAGVAREVAPHGVTINNMLPGSFDTDRLQSNFNAIAGLTEQTPEAAREARRLGCAPKRFGLPEEFGATCAFLCSKQAGYINAQNILLDGGTFPGVL